MKRVNRVQRIARREEKSVVKRIFLLSVVSIVLIVFIFTIGINLLGNFADFLESIFESSDASQNSESAPVTPIIDTLPASTNQERIKVAGFSGNAAKVEIYLDLREVSEVETSDGRFEFNDFLLSRGENKISLKAINNNGDSSDFSKVATIFLDMEPPELQIDSPSDGQHFSGNNRVKITGKTEATAQVFAHGFLANVDANGEFEVTIPLEVEGENKIEIKAVDDAGNSETKELKLHFKK